MSAARLAGRARPGIPDPVVRALERIDGDVLVERGRGGGHRRVTALVSGGPQDAAVVGRAAAIAIERDAELVILHVWPGGRTDPLDVVHRARRVADGHRPTPAVRTRIEKGYAHEAVARANDTDLLVVGYADSPGARRCGTVTSAAVQHAQCPVLVLRPVSGPGPSAHDAGPVDI